MCISTFSTGTIVTCQFYICHYISLFVSYVCAMLLVTMVMYSSNTVSSYTSYTKTLHSCNTLIQVKKSSRYCYIRLCSTGFKAVWTLQDFQTLQAYFMKKFRWQEIIMCQIFNNSISVIQHFTIIISVIQYFTVFLSPCLTTD